MKDCGPHLKKYMKKHGMKEGDSAVFEIEDGDENPFEPAPKDDDDKKKGKK